MENSIKGVLRLFNNYQLSEVSAEFLQTLAERFPLNADQYDQNDGKDLLITVAIHAELSRRANGGKQLRQEPTVKELALDVVSKGFQQTSKVHHPDQQGEHEARLGKARDRLQELCSQIENELEQDAVIISPPSAPTRTAAHGR